MRIMYFVVIGVLFFYLLSQKAIAQGQDKTVIFSGQVVAQEAKDFLPGAYLFNVRAGRGGITDNFGNFSLYTFPGDSIVVSYIGFAKKYFVVPPIKEQTYTAIIYLKEEVTNLATVNVYPYRSEEEFKKGFLAMRTANEKDRENLYNNVEKSKLRILALRTSLGAAGNYRNFSQQMTFDNSNRNAFFSPLSSLTNPFAWLEFINSIKRGDLKKDDWKKAYEVSPTEDISTDKFIRDQKIIGN